MEYSEFSRDAADNTLSDDHILGLLYQLVELSKAEMADMIDRIERHRPALAKLLGLMIMTGQDDWMPSVEC